MTAGSTPAKAGFWRIVALMAMSALVASCTTSSDTMFEVNSPSFAASAVAVAAGEGAAEQAVDGQIPDSAATPGSVVVGETASDDQPLPEAVAYVPTASPGTASFPAAPSAPKPAEAAVADATDPAPVEKPADTTTVAVAASTPKEGQPEFFLSNPGPTAAPPAPKKRGFLTNLFGATPAEAAPLRTAKPEPEKPLVQLASVETNRPVGAAAFADGERDALPGVRQSALFEIKRKSGLDDDSDVDLHEEDDNPGAYRVASAAGLARLAPNGLLKQTDNVDVACLKPSLVRTLKAVERHYGRKIMVTSGYRNPERNRRARGAKNSLHMYCAAADVQVPGISKWELANFVRSMPGRGGVGTYCHTESVHIDVGPERDWNWRCRGKRKKRA